MCANKPIAELRLQQDFNPKAASSAPDLDELQLRLSQLPGLDEVQVEPWTRSSVVARVPARNKRELEDLRRMINERLDGWQALEQQAYSVPKTF